MPLHEKHSRVRALFAAKLGTPGTKTALALAGVATLLRYAGAVIGQELDVQAKRRDGLISELHDTRLQLWALETVLHNRGHVSPEEFQAAYEDVRVLKTSPTIAQEPPESAPGPDVPAGAVAVPPDRSGLDRSGLWPSEETQS